MAKEKTGNSKKAKRSLHLKAYYEYYRKYVSRKNRTKKLKTHIALHPNDLNAARAWDEFSRI